MPEKKKNNLYNDDSIQSLSPLEFTRLRPGVYCGSTEYSTQLVLELVSNSIDEHNLGHGDTIDVTINGDTITVTDNGQGFPIGVMRDDGTSVLEASFSVINTSGKYDDNGVYEGTSLGLNGIGAKLCVYLSKSAEITSYSGTHSETVTFKDGVFQSRVIRECNRHSGTMVSFVPDEQFFTYQLPNAAALEKFFDEVTALSPSLYINFNNNCDIKVFHHEDGIVSLLKSKVSDDFEITNEFILNQSAEKRKLSLAMVYTTKNNCNIIPYVNFGLTDSGPHITAIKSCITRTLNKWAREQSLLKEKDKNLDGTSLQEGLVLIFNLISPGVSYDAQTKSRIVNNDFVPFLNTTFGDLFEQWLDRHPSDGKNIIDKALIARKASEAAKKAKEQVREKAKIARPTGPKITTLPTKLTDCTSKNRSECELYVVEGDSAGGGAKTIRNSKTQAIMPLRGKLLNVLTAQSRTIQANQEIDNIIHALGLQWTSDKKSVIYDKDHLRYGKFIIASDRDRDGSHIQVLILTFLWHFIPQLLLGGYVYLALPPLYKAEWGTKYQYIADDRELEEFKKTHGKFQLNYYKGLGEASAQELGQMIMNPQTRKIEQIKVDDIDNFDKIINNLMGKDTIPKKNFVFGERVKEI